MKDKEKEKTMKQIAKENKKGWSFIDTGKGIILKVKNKENK